MLMPRPTTTTFKVFGALIGFLLLVSLNDLQRLSLEEAQANETTTTENIYDFTMEDIDGKPRA